MGKKKNKDTFDVDNIDQENMLEELNEALENGEIPNYNTETDTISGSYDLSDVLGMFLNSSDEDCEEDEYEEEDSSDVFEIPINATERVDCGEYTDFGEYEEINTSSVDTTEANKLRATCFQRLNKNSDDAITPQIFHLSDCAKDVSIDLNSLNRDYEVMSDDEKEQLLSDTTCGDLIPAYLSSVLQNFYPTAILPAARLGEVLNQIQKYDKDKFYFYECPGNENVILAYYVPDESLVEFEEVIIQTINQDTCISFLSTLKEILETCGVSFVNVGEGYISQLQFTEYYRNAVEPFLTVLSDNSINDGDISSVEMGNLLPLEYCEPRIEELLYGSQEQEEPSQSFDINIGEVIPPTDIPEDEEEEEMTIFSESDAVEFDEIDYGDEEGNEDYPTEEITDTEDVDESTTVAETETVDEDLFDDVEETETITLNVSQQETESNDNFIVKRQK